MFTAVIFDRDGVLTDFDLAAAAAYFAALLPLSMQELATRWNAWGAIVGFPRNLEEEAKFWAGFWQQLADDFHLSPAAQGQLRQVDYTRFLQPFPDARPALLTAREYGLRTGVLSNFSLASLDGSLTAVGLADLVDAACAAPVIGASKPDQEAYLAITRALGVQPEQCLFFDDELKCVIGARQARMTAFFVNRQQASHDLPAGIVRDLAALPSILNQTVKPM
jgi:putative hydrolase of the HAD superfamily